MKPLFTALFLFLVPFAIWSQEQAPTIEATVVDSETKEAVAYASVGVLGSYKGTSTNMEGQFSLSLDAKQMTGGAKLKISCVGYESATFALGAVPKTIALKPSKVQLRDLVVLEKTLNAAQIVKKALGRVKQNYYAKPFVYKTFYRHYCKDDSVYGRLIEGAVDIYKRKGHKAVTALPGQKEEVRVSQLRRSLDSTKVSGGHAPIALYSVMAGDLISYQFKGGELSVAIDSYAKGVSSLKKDIKNFDLKLEGITSYDGQDVYEISLESNNKVGVQLTSGIMFARKIKGTLFINASNYAVVKSDMYGFGFDTLHMVNTYQKAGSKYFLRHSTKEGQTYHVQNKFRHTYHLDLMVNEIQLKDFKKFKGKEPGKAELFNVPYDSTFWNGYSILKETPLEEKIIGDLGGSKSLTNQFAIYDTLVRAQYERQISGEGQFEEFLKESQGHRILFLSLWASWCGPCIKEMPFEKKLAEEYRGKVTFVMLSLDADEKAWNRALMRHDLRTPYLRHYRIGPEAAYLKFLEVETIPRYVIIQKDGKFFDLNAKRPSDPALKLDLNKVKAAGGD